MMKQNRRLAAAFLVIAALAGLASGANAGVSVSIGQPGFYGRLDIGGYPAPALIYPEPVIINPVPVAGPPIYLRVPPGHAKNWRRYCYRYGACGERVYFVQDRWYTREYAPRYMERYGPPHARYREGWREDRHDRRYYGHRKHDD